MSFGVWFSGSTHNLHTDRIITDRIVEDVIGSSTQMSH